MAHQYIFQMQRLTKAYGPEKPILNDVTLAFYRRYTTMDVIHERVDDTTGLRTAWLANPGDTTDSGDTLGIQGATFVIVLICGYLLAPLFPATGPRKFALSAELYNTWQWCAMAPRSSHRAAVLCWGRSTFPSTMPTMPRSSCRPTAPAPT